MGEDQGEGDSMMPKATAFHVAWNGAARTKVGFADQFYPPHPGLLPPEKESGRAARRVIGGALAHDNLKRTIVERRTSVAPSPGGEGWGEGGPHIDSALTH